MKTALLSSAAALGAIVLLAGAADAAVITSTVPTWQKPQGASVTYGSLGNGQNTYITVRWGASGNNASGLGFNPASPPSANVNPNQIFLLGNLQHYNNPVTGRVPTSVDLALATSFQGAAPIIQSFLYRFFIDETPNNTPCTYPSSTLCADRITFSNLDTTNSFTLGGVNYTIELTGFPSNNGQSFTHQFISQEGQTNTVGLYGRITAVTPVPEPVSMALFGMGLVGLAMVRSRKSRSPSACEPRSTRVRSPREA